MSIKTLMVSVLAGAVGAWVLVGCGEDRTPQRAQGEPAEGAPSPSAMEQAAPQPAAPEAADALDFTLNDQNGNPVRAGDYAGRIVVLEWFNYDCPFVQRHYKAGTFKDLAAEFADDVVWLAINSTHYATAAKNKEWVDAHALPYPVLDDHDGSVGRKFGARTTPHLFVIGADGNVVYNGAIDDDPGGKKEAPVSYVRQVIEALLAGSQPPVNETKPYGCSVKYK